MNEAIIVVFAGGILTPNIRPKQLIQLIGSFLPFLKCFGFSQIIEESVARLPFCNPAISFLVET